jgi:hypothetical protein
LMLRLGGRGFRLDGGMVVEVGEGVYRESC